MKKIKFLLLASFLISTTGTADGGAFGPTTVSSGNTCVLFGSSHAFGISAAPGWVMDNQSGRGQGLHMVFYPQGESWANSTIMAYGRSLIKADLVGIAGQVDRTIKDFKSNGSPDFKALKQASVALPGGKQAEIYFYTGDQWNNYEAVAYFDELETINFLVFHSKTKEAFEKNLSAFYAMVGTYKNFYITEAEQGDISLVDLEVEADKQSKTPKGIEYESITLKLVGQKMAKTMRDCASYFPENDLQPFSYFVRIGGSGKILREYLFPTQNPLGVCFKSYMSNVIYPEHDMDSFLWEINMKIGD